MRLPLESYYRIPGLAENNIALDDQVLVVNCCGRLSMDHHFMTKSPAGRNDFYLLYMWEGEMRLRYRAPKRSNAPGEKAASRTGTSRTISSGDMVILPPHTAYTYESLGGEVMYYWVHFTGSFATRLVQSLSPEVSIMSPGLLETVETYFSELFTSFIFRDEQFEVAAHTLLMNILWSLLRRHSGANQTDHRQAKIAASLQFIHRNMANPIAVEALADMEHLSPSRYRTVFRTCMGTSPSEYIISLRMQRACELMEHFDMSIAEVALSVGYGDPLYFSRLFKKKLGISPSAYLLRSRTLPLRNND